jgi:hypothetical protein
MIIGGFAAGVRILLEKGPSRDHILKIRKILEKYQKNYIFPEDSGSQKEEARGARGRLTHRGRSLTPGRAGLV